MEQLEIVLFLLKTYQFLIEIFILNDWFLIIFNYKFKELKNDVEKEAPLERFSEMMHEMKNETELFRKKLENWQQKTEDIKNQLE